MSSPSALRDESNDADFFCVAAKPTSVENRFGLRSCRPRGQVSHCEYVVSPWATDTDGKVRAGALAVAADHILGEVLFDRRPPRSWLLTTELTLDLMGEVASAAILEVDGSLVRLEHRGGFARCTLTDADGAAVALATTRGVYVPATPRQKQPKVKANAPELKAIAPVQKISASTLEELLAVEGTTSAAGAQVHMADPSNWTNVWGILHGGIWACLAEMAASLAVGHRNAGLSTARLHTTYLRPGAPGAAVTASARTYHVGGSLAVTEVLGHTAEGTLCTVSTVTARRVGEVVQ
jgi:uncharacterized protein (TIGR00369 family)